MSIILILFYGSFFGIVAMLVLRMARGLVHNNTTIPGGDLGLSAVGAPVVHKISAIKGVFINRARTFVLALTKTLLEYFLAFYKKGGVFLLRVRDSVSRAGKEKKLGTGANVSNYIKDVLDHKETIRNGNGPKSN